MDRYRLYSTDEMQTLKEKLRLYKEILYFMKSGSVTDDYLLTKMESNDFKFNLEGVMNKMEDYNYEAGEKTKLLSAQLQSVNETVNVLKKDLEAIKDKMDRLQIHDLMEKMNRVIDTQQTSVKQETTSEVDRLKDEITYLKGQIQSAPQQTMPETPVPVQESRQAPARTSEYRKLQNMLQSSRSYTSARNDHYPPMSNRQAGNQSSYYQNQQAANQTSFPNQSMNDGKRKKYNNPQMDMNKNTIIRKKNAEESAQSITDGDNTGENKLQFHYLIKKALENGPMLQKTEEQKNLSKDSAEPTEKVEEKKKEKQEQHSINEENHPSVTNGKENKEPAKKMELSSLFSIFQKRN
ncbi:hypothetical protein [Halobacillus litoralis]|uniref:hypothetical protein n=1 Tax=Halobacillus litoralis TaxID=45668 RepID=UPI0024910D48|nr:hypothetical protein [Halobacillus litoralis]